MTVERTFEDGRLTLVVSGRLDTNTAPELEAETRLDGVTEVVFDFAALDYISSAGLRILLGAQKAMMSVGGTMRVLRPNAMVQGVFDVTGLSGVFTVVK